ncbi:glycosyltransferase family 2 protein [Frigidibacter sp. SD6-1]|uniref:glycosyltransferase n=1 Tax=Frigidibacter sp. SD6-1 TaxID=3032581 RepID=UPI0024DF8CB6|nr:glycosyltransferase family 2 protein [Frigidibacter sp. SD6-1]
MSGSGEQNRRGSPTIGVVIVTFNAADVIGECLTSLLSQTGERPGIVVVDNQSTDGTVGAIRDWAAAPGRPCLSEQNWPSAATPADGLCLIHSGANRGFAGGVNIGLAALADRPEIGHFWVLNPDAFADPGATDAILAAAARWPGYGIMGGRVQYAEPPCNIQIDGGTINRWTGVTGNINLGRPASMPQPEAQEVDFVTGANLVVSRRFYEKVGPMREDYFLYYEEVDWALRRGDLALVVAPGFLVHHHAGTAIGSPTLNRLASPFSIWFKYRGRMKFVRRFLPLSWPLAMAHATAKAMQLALKGAWPQALTILAAVYGLPAPRMVRDRLTPDAQEIAFGKRGR